MMSSSSDDETEPVVKRPRATKSIMSSALAIACADTDLSTFDDCSYVNFVVQLPRPSKKVVVNHCKKDTKGSSDDAFTSDAIITSSSGFVSNSPAKFIQCVAKSSEPCGSFKSSVDSIPCAVIRDPTPPSSPSKSGRTTCKRPPKRLKKGVKQAMAKLEKMQKIIRKRDVNRNNQLDVDDDVEKIDLTDSSCSVMTSRSDNVESPRTISVKVRCMSGLRRYQMKLGESFVRIFEDIATAEQTTASKVLLLLRDETIRSYHSPASVGLSVADIIECHIRRGDVADVTFQGVDGADAANNSIDSSQTIRIHLQDGKKEKITLNIHKDEPMEKLRQEFCTLRQLRTSSVSFQQDGEAINLSFTPEDLDLENDDCIDVVHIKH